MPVQWWQMPCQWSSHCSAKLYRAVAELDVAGCGIYLCRDCVPKALAAGQRVRWCAPKRAVAQ